MSKFRLYSFKGCKIGDKIASAYQLQYEKQKNGTNFLLIDPTYDSPVNFPIKQFFPDISEFVIETHNPDLIFDELKDKIEPIGFSNLWISSPSLFQDTGFVPKMKLPSYAQQFRDSFAIQDEEGKPIRKLKECPMVIINHCLLDPAYNKGRQHNPEQWQKVMDRIRDYIKEKEYDAIVVDIPAYQLPFQQVISLIDLAHIMISGDTGTTHIASALGKEIVAIYGDDSHDIRDFHHEKEKGGYIHEWCSDPVSKTYTKFVMKDHLFDEDAVFNHVVTLIDKKLQPKL